MKPSSTRAIFVSLAGNVGAEATYASEMDQVTHALEREITERFPLVKFVYVKAVVQNNVLPQGIQLAGYEISLADRTS